MLGFNPYVLLGGGVAALAIAGSMYVQSTMVHKYHTAYDCVESGLNCPKNAENIPHLRALVTQMTTAQNNQTKQTDQHIIRVVQGPRQLQPIINEINTAPTKSCTIPSYSDEVKNAF